MKKIIKILGIGCASIFGLFILFIALGVYFASDSETKSGDENSDWNSIVTDSLVLKEQKRINDSVANVKTEKLKKAKKELNKFKKIVDEFEGTTFYKDPRAPKYTSVNFIYPYIGEEEGRYWLRLKFQYTSTDWLFINKAVLLIDGVKFDLYGKWERDNDSEIWEWLDIPVKEKEQVILEKLASSKEAKIRYEGSKYYKDRTITKKEKSIIKKTLDIFNNLN